MDPREKEQYTAFFWAENRVTHPGYEYIIHLDDPRCMIKFHLADAMFTTYEEFYESVAEVQWLDGPNSAPAGAELEEFMCRAWNYLALEEEILDRDLDEMDEDF